MKVVAIVGPTAVGKTALSIELAKAFSGEIISGDSMQVYKNLNIGTAKVTPEEQADIPHYLIDILNWDQTYSAFDFKQQAEKKISEITSRHHLPIIAGGTGLYIQSLVENYTLGTGEKSEIDEKKDSWEELRKKDPNLALTTHPNNQRRIQQALKRGANKKQDSIYDVFYIGLNTKREVLHERINQRVDVMMEKGLLNEAQEVYEFSLQHPQKNFTVLQAIGYKEFFPYFKGEIGLEEVVNQLKTDSRRYAKRQITWFKNRMNVPFYNLVEDPNEIIEIKKQLKEWLGENR